MKKPIAGPTIPRGAPDAMMAATTSEQIWQTSVVRWELLTMLVMESDARLNPAHVAIGRARYRTAAERFYWVAVRAQCVEAARRDLVLWMRWSAWERRQGMAPW